MEFKPVVLTGIHRPIIQYHKSVYPGIDNPLDCPRCGSDAQVTGQIDTPPVAAQLYAQQRGGVWKWSARRCYCPQCHNIFDIVDEHLLGLP